MAWAGKEGNTYLIGAGIIFAWLLLHLPGPFLFVQSPGPNAIGRGPYVGAPALALAAMMLGALARREGPEIFAYRSFHPPALLFSGEGSGYDKSVFTSGLGPTLFVTVTRYPAPLLLPLAPVLTL